MRDRLTLCCSRASKMRQRSCATTLTSASAPPSRPHEQFLDSDAAWRYKFPATFMFYGDAACDVSALADWPNFFKSRDAKQCKAFALFKPLAAMSR